MESVRDFLRGKKSYLMAFGVGCVAFALQLGWIDGQTAVVLFGLLGAGSVASLRAGMVNQ